MTKSLFLSVLLLGAFCSVLSAQNRLPADSTGLTINMDAVYNRPFLQVGKMPVALGGYAEVKGERLPGQSARALPGMFVDREVE